MKSILPKTLPCFFTLCLIAVLSACGKKETKPPALPPAEVSVATAAAERVNRTMELPGRINSVREAQVRARATGILLKRSFEEGSNVKKARSCSRSTPLLCKRASTARKRRWPKRKLR